MTEGAGGPGGVRGSMDETSEPGSGHGLGWRGQGGEESAARILACVSMGLGVLRLVPINKARGSWGSKIYTGLLLSDIQFLFSAHVT